VLTSHTSARIVRRGRYPPSWPGTVHSRAPGLLRAPRCRRPPSLPSVRIAAVHCPARQPDECRVVL